MENETPMKNFRFAYFLVFVCLLFVGCASASKFENMAVRDTLYRDEVRSSAFKKTLSVKKVAGGKETNPLWASQVSNEAFQSALESSMNINDLLAENENEAKFDLYTTLQKLDQPLFGLDLTVTSEVNYRVTDKKSKDTIMDENISASYTATFSDSMIGIQRLRLANEGAVRENIRLFIVRLLEIQIPEN